MNNIILLGIVSFFTDISSEMITPILPMFITALGGAGLIVGLIGGLGDSISSMLNVFSGYWSDKFGKKKQLVFAGYGVSAIAKLLFPFALIWQHILALRVFERFGKGIRTAPRDVILAVSTEKGRRGRGFGIHRAMDSAGAVIGSALAFILIWNFGLDFRTIFLAAAIIAFLALAPIIPVKEKVVKRKKIALKIDLKKLSKPLKIFILIATIFSLGNFSYMFFILRSQEFFAKDLSIVMPILLYIIYNIVYTMFSIPAGILSDKIGRRKVLLAGYFLFGLTCLGFAFLHSLTYFIMLFILYGLVYALTDGTARALVSDISKEEIRGTALGTFHTSISLSTLPASLIAGALWQFVSFELTFIYGAFMASLAVFLLLVSQKLFR